MPAAAELQLALEPVRVGFGDDEITTAHEGPEGWQLSGTWALSDTMDVRIGFQDAQSTPRSVVSSPFWSDYDARGYSVAFNQQGFGPFELFGRVGVMNVDVATRTLKIALDDQQSRISFAGGGLRWRPASEDWGFEAGANRATGRPTNIGVGVFISF